MADRRSARVLNRRAGSRTQFAGDRRTRLFTCTIPVVLAAAVLVETGVHRASHDDRLLVAAGESATPATEEAKPAVPDNAIPIGDDLYLVPLGKDGDGCEQFSPVSPTKVVATVIYYRDRDGGFTTDKLKAGCH